MDHTRARTIATEIITALRPHCTWIKVAGSIRRLKPQPKDAEIVCVPHSEPLDLLDTPGHSLKFLQALYDFDVTKPTRKDHREARQFRIEHKGLGIDLFTASPVNVGWIYFLRTGPYQWNIEVISRLRRIGITSQGGQLWKQGSPLITESESDVFQLLRMPTIEPEKRANNFSWIHYLQHQ